MSYRLSKIYTRKGDDGTTSLDAKHRISKNHIRLEAIGTIDELNSALGLIIAFMNKPIKLKNALMEIQQELFDLGGELCPPYRHVITPDKTLRLETELDEWNVSLSPLKEFIMPGGNSASATCHLARTICRRAERILVSLNEVEKINPEILRYVNRLSDFLFVAARILAKDSGIKEVEWHH